MVTERYVDEWNPLFTAWWRQCAQKWNTFLVTSNSRYYLIKPLIAFFSSHVCNGFTASFILVPLLFEEHCPESGWKSCTITAERLFHNHVVPALQESLRDRHTRVSCHHLHAGWFPACKVFKFKWSSPITKFDLSSMGKISQMILYL